MHGRADGVPVLCCTYVQYLGTRLNEAQRGSERDATIVAVPSLSIKRARKKSKGVTDDEKGMLDTRNSSSFFAMVFCSHSDCIETAHFLHRLVGALKG